MGTSFTEFSGFGFWSRDTQIEVWLCLVVRQIDNEHDPADWMLEIREQFVTQATAGMNGCVSPELDRFASSNERRQWLISLGRVALGELVQIGELVPSDWLGKLFHIDRSMGKPALFTRPVEASYFRIYGEKWISLLKGNPAMPPDPLWDDIVVSSYSWR